MKLCKFSKFNSKMSEVFTGSVVKVLHNDMVGLGPTSGDSTNNGLQAL